MADTIPYMGTKRDLSAAVVRATTSCKDGTVVDLFAGMGSVAAAHNGLRRVWANDVQHFAYLNNKCRLTCANPTLSAALGKAEEKIFDANLVALLEQSKASTRAEKDALLSESFVEFDLALREAEEYRVEFRDAYCCFVNRYARTYFSLRQCAEIDSIRCLLESLRGFGKIDQEQFDWGVLCLGAVALRCANTTGHFAQYLKPNIGNWRRVQRQFARSIWKLWIASLAELKPFGDPDWRSGNRATRVDALSALQSADFSDVGVVYCDPPYTNDQYSRYYHIWETVVLYDYPEKTGVGQYRGGRYTTDFSLVKRVSEAFEALVGGVASAQADLVLSYPSNGLLYEAGADPLDVVRKHFPIAYLGEEIAHRHSSMGASKGQQKHLVFERIYIGRHGT